MQQSRCEQNENLAFLILEAPEKYGAQKYVDNLLKASYSLETDSSDT